VGTIQGAKCILEIGVEFCILLDLGWAWVTFGQQIDILSVKWRGRKEMEH
jgi:hypothetical protein